MFVVAQFPLADFRCFLDVADTRARLTPSWPPRTEVPAQFLRYFGRAADRHRGVDYAWVDEEAFCRANRAIRFPRLPNPTNPAGVNGWMSETRCAFRRLLFDGRAVARVELGFSFQSQSAQSELWRTWDSIVATGRDPAESAREGLQAHRADPLAVSAHVLALPSTVPRLSEPPTPRTLAQQGRALAELYFRASAQLPATAITERGNEWLKYVAQGAPVVLIEARTAALDSLPAHFIRIPATSTNGVPLAFGRIRTRFGVVDTWVLGCSLAQSRQIRNLRICLLRLHAEQQALALTLDRVRTGALSYEPGTEHGDRLETYLNEATRLIDRKEWASIQQSQILAAFDALQASDAAGTTRLGQRLEGMRLQIRRKVERFESRTERTIQIGPGATYVEQQIMQEKVINIGSGNTISAPLVIADQIQNSFNAVKGSNASPEIKALVEQLLQQVATAAKAKPEVARDMTDVAETLTKEVTREKPRREWYELSVKGLKDAAIAVGEVGKPILETVGKLLPLLVALWP